MIGTFGDDCSREPDGRPPDMRPLAGTASVVAAGPPPPRPRSSVPLTEQQAAAHVHGICFKTGPPGKVGVELEWLVYDVRDPTLAVGPERVAAALAGLDSPGALPAGGCLTTEPGGQLELSSLPAASIGECVAATSADLAVVRAAMQSAGLCLAGHGLDPCRPPRRVLDVPRYAAMEMFFDRSGFTGRVMMCSTASVQVCLDAGEDAGERSYRRRWRVLHAIGPVLVAAFANSPLLQGRATGWRSTRYAVWASLDPSRTSPVIDPRRSATGGPGASDHPGIGAGPSPPPWDARWPDGGVSAGAEVRAGSGNGHLAEAGPRARWADYALDAKLMCIRRPGPRAWTVPPGLTFRGWLRAADAAIAGPRIPVGARGGAAAHGGALPIGAAAAHGGAPPPGAAGLHRPTIDDLDYHLSTLFPPVRPRGHLELRMIDAQPGDGWVVPVVIAAAILDDPEAGQAAMAATQPLWSAGLDPWLRAARDGPADRDIAAASRACFDAAHSALRRLDTPASLLTAAAEFTERYVQRDRCPADDLLEEMA